MPALRITEFAVGNNLAGILVNRRSLIRNTGAGKPYLDCVLTDGRTSICGKLWDYYSAEVIPQNTPVYFEGIVDSFKDKLQIKLSLIREAGPNEYNKYDFLEKSPYNPDDMLSELQGYANNISNYYLKEILNKALFENKAVLRAFVNSPAGKIHHHFYISGLLEHTLTTVRIAVAIASSVHIYIDMDLLVVGCILHDLAKIKEYSVSIVIEMTDASYFKGHLAPGYEYVVNLFREFPDYKSPEVQLLEYKLSNMILSHHGPRENGGGSTVNPVTPEAYILHMADLTDYTLFKYKNTKENAAPDQKWEYVRGLGGHIYVGN